MKNLAIIGASYLQLPLIEKAKELGYTTHVFAWKANDVGEYAADHFYPISIVDVDEIAAECRRIGICGICSISTDLGNYTVNYVADKLGLTGNSMDSTLKSTNKYLMRKAFLENGDPCPKCIRVEPGVDFDISDFDYPLIVKPTDRSGSRGVFLVEDPADLGSAVESALNEGFEKRVLIEEYAEGKEYSIEGISYKGHHHILAVTEKYTTGAPHFIETGHHEPALLSGEQVEKISSVILHALDSLEIKNSASHSEIKIDSDGNIKIIEIGARMGGDCIGSDLVRYSTGIDYLKAVIQLACGEEPDLTPSGETHDVEVRFILNEDDLKTFEYIKEHEPHRLLKIVNEADLSLIGKTTNSSDRAGCYIISND